MRKKAGIIWTVLAAGVIYFCWLKLTGIGIPCIFRKITGWYCPGCGITTLILCISEMDFVGAFHANPFLFVTSPFLLGELAAEWIRVRKGRKISVWNEKLLMVYTVCLCMFGVWRNVI